MLTPRLNPQSAVMRYSLACYTLERKQLWLLVDIYMYISLLKALKIKEYIFQRTP